MRALVTFHGGIGSPYYGCFAGEGREAITAWREGETRSVPDGQADYLLETYPGCFERVGFEVSQDEGPDPLAMLGAAPAREIAAAISAGDFDASLLDVLKAEHEGKNRKTVIAAITARADLLEPGSGEE